MVGPGGSGQGSVCLCWRKSSMLSLGVDTHRDTHQVEITSPSGTPIATITISNDSAGYEKLLAWIFQHAPGPRVAVSIEGTRGYGAGLGPRGHRRWPACSSADDLRQIPKPLTRRRPNAHQTSSPEATLRSSQPSRPRSRQCRARSATHRGGIMTHCVSESLHSMARTCRHRSGRLLCRIHGLVGATGCTG